MADCMPVALKGSESHAVAWIGVVGLWVTGPSPGEVAAGESLRVRGVAAVGTCWGASGVLRLHCAGAPVTNTVLALAERGTAGRGDDPAAGTPSLAVFPAGLTVVLWLTAAL